MNNARRTPRLEIHFCPGCRWQARAAWMAQEFLTTFGERLGEVALIPADAGVFEIFLGDECLHARRHDGNFPELKPLKQMIRDRVDAGMPLGHSDN